jgi:phenylpropionate dioxygenase-like ring-hydroxylating dioxygenase large terminal subunit
MFLKNAWYVAARDCDVTQKLRSVRILGERIVLYRTRAGDPAALEDACAHRKLPLSMGRVCGDQVECGYHGLTFDASGRCTRVPASTVIPPTAKVRSYPAVSRHGFVWVWTGDPEQASPERIFPVEHANDPAWGRDDGGEMSVDCNYLYVTDNLLDPSHVAWVHRTSFGNSECEEVPIQVTTLADGMVAWRWMHDAEVAPFYAQFVRFRGRADRLQHYEVRYPSHAIIRAVFVPAGTGGEGKPLHPDAMIMDSYNFLTPTDEDHTRYFWFQSRNFAPHDAQVDKMMDEGVQAVFEEDRIILAAVHEGMKNRIHANIDLASDRAPNLFRLRLKKLIAAEQESQPTAT